MTIRSTFGSLLDDDFDLLDPPPDESAVEQFSATSLDLDGHSRDSIGRRRRRTTRLEDPQVLLPEDPPPGWAKP
jgi:hypothetical protein